MKQSGENRLRAAIQRARAVPVETPHMLLLRVCTRLTQNELRAVVFEIGGDYDDLVGDTLADKAGSLVANARRHGAEAWLLAAIRRRRPDLDAHLQPLEQVFGS